VVSLDYTAQIATFRPMTPYGAPRGTQPTSWPNDKGFVGGTTDTATGLTNLGVREYDPTLGRFLSADPVLEASDPNQIGGYAYAGNNPVTLSDPSGAIPDGCGTEGPCYGYSSQKGCPGGCGSTENVAWGEAHGMTPDKGGRCTAGHCGVPKPKPSPNDVAAYNRLIKALQQYWKDQAEDAANVAKGQAGACTGSMPYGCGTPTHAINAARGPLKWWQKLMIGAGIALPVGFLCVPLFLECVSAGGTAAAGANAAMSGEGIPELSPSEATSLLEEVCSSGGACGVPKIADAEYFWHEMQTPKGVVGMGGNVEIDGTHVTISNVSVYGEEGLERGSLDSGAILSELRGNIAPALASQGYKSLRIEGGRVSGPVGHVVDFTVDLTRYSGGSQ
jgi:RHS repeat-associated protein